MTKVLGSIIAGWSETVNSSILTLDLPTSDRKPLGSNKSILEREIQVIEELAEVEPNCKCKLHGISILSDTDSYWP